MSAPHNNDELDGAPELLGVADALGQVEDAEGDIAMESTTSPKISSSTTIA
jgi:hypothetical protein